MQSDIKSTHHGIEGVGYYPFKQFLEKAVSVDAKKLPMLLAD